MAECYDYRESMRDDIHDYIMERTPEELIRRYGPDMDDIRDGLDEELWAADSVTGNGSGSYYFNAWEAEEALCHNWDLLADALEEFGGDRDILRQGPEACDVTIRCYLLGECLGDVLEDLEEEFAAAIGAGSAEIEEE